MENELRHYGVLGMKWGVRKIRPKSSDGKKRRISYDDDVVIKAGTKAYRVSSDKNDGSGRKYLTVDQNDRKFYKAMWPTQMRKIGTGGKDIYENTYKLKEDLVSPSAKKREKIANNLMKKKEVTDEVAKTLLVNKVVSMGNRTPEEARHGLAYDLASKNKDAIHAYNSWKKAVTYMVENNDSKSIARTFFGTMGTSDVIKGMYGREVVKRGYNMSIDDHGADFPGKSDRVNAPIIVFKAEKALNQIKSKKLYQFDSERALTSYVRSIQSTPGRMSQKYFVPNVIKESSGSYNYYRTSRNDMPYDRNNVKIKRG